MERFQAVAAPSAKKEEAVGVGIHVVGIADDRHESVYGLPHVCVTADKVDLPDAGDIA